MLLKAGIYSEDLGSLGEATTNVAAATFPNLLTIFGTHLVNL